VAGEAVVRENGPHLAIEVDWLLGRKGQAGCGKSEEQTYSQ
jgi:hypothetical protein